MSKKKKNPHYDFVKNVPVRPTPEKCKTCMYREMLANSAGNTMHQTCCDYILIEFKSRGCAAGSKCTKYKPYKGRKKRCL